jgi:hypothetical protein
MTAGHEKAIAMPVRDQARAFRPPGSGTERPGLTGATSRPFASIFYFARQRIAPRPRELDQDTEERSCEQSYGSTRISPAQATRDALAFGTGTVWPDESSGFLRANCVPRG